jgi:hypothetical protein
MLMEIDRVTTYYAQSISKPDMVVAKVTYATGAGEDGWVVVEMAGIDRQSLA